ncbi:MAG: pantoate--beta-alanine ligase [Lentimonas sp.]|jgi:pantoate--beta-alanine ligase
MQIFNQITEIRGFLKNQNSKKIGLVPTMGALHQGHLSLIEEAKKHCDLVVVTIFVNKEQFNNEDDYLNYPNLMAGDIEILQQNNVDILFNPSMDEIYQNNLTKIEIGKLADNLCGKSRAGHFEGVALIVSKLFNIIRPDVAVFGQKDFQQLQIIKKLTCDLNFDVKIIGAETLREESGLAMSSRNLNLSESGRKIADQIYANLNAAKKEILGGTNLQLVLEKTNNNLLQNGVRKIDYLNLCDEDNLQITNNSNSKIKSRLFIAAHVDEVRLIDNLEIY